MQSQNIVHIYLTLCPIQLHGTVFSISTACLRICIFPLEKIQHDQCSQFQKQAWGRKKQCQDSGILFEMLQQQCFPITSVESSHVKKRALRFSVVHSPFLPPGLHITVSALRNRTQKQPHGAELQPNTPSHTENSCISSSAGRACVLYFGIRIQNYKNYTTVHVLLLIKCSMLLEEKQGTKRKSKEERGRTGDMRER